MAYDGPNPYPVNAGGTDRQSFTPNTPICGGTTSTSALQSVASTGSVGQVLTSNGAAALPSFQTPAVTTDLHVAKLIVNPLGSSGGGNYTTITSALAAATSGETIFITPGTYTENLTLKAGVNLTACTGDSTLYNNASSFNVKIIGTLSASFSGSCNISNICLQTNSALILSITGSADTDVVFNQCFINASNNSAFACTSSNNSCQIVLNNCFGNLLTTGINYFSMTNGTVYSSDTTLSNSGGSTTVNTLANSSGVNFTDTVFIANITANDSSVLQTKNSTISGALILNGTSFINAGYCDFGGGGAASAITIAAGASALLKSCIINSANTNALTGAGTVTFAGLVFQSSSGNNVTSQIDYAFGSNVMFPAGGAIRTSKTAGNTALLQAYDVDGASYTTFATLTANNTPTFDLSTSTTIGGSPIGSGNVTAALNMTDDAVVRGDGGVKGVQTSTVLISDAGQMTNPSQPAFLAYLGTTDTNATGDGTNFVIGSGNALTEVFDQGGNFVTTGTFTAPITGRYFLQMAIEVVGGSTITGANFFINTSNRNYRNDGSGSSGVTTAIKLMSTLADMDSADTATFSVSTSDSGGKVDDVFGSATPFTWCSGYLVC